MDDIDWNSVRGRSVLITGGASGLGEATATCFAQHGAYVTIADISTEQGQQLAEKLGETVTFVHCDTTDWASSVAAFKHCAQFGPFKTIDIVVLFAGLGGEQKSLVDLVLEQPAPTLEGDPTPARPAHKALDVNLVGVYISTYLALHYFRLPSLQPQSFRKSLVLVSSLMAYVDGAYNTGYATSKFGVRGLFRSLRSQTHKINARINNIAPGYVLTPLVQRVHQIQDPSEKSKAAGRVLPWSPIEYVVQSVMKCAVDEHTNGELEIHAPQAVADIFAGRTFAIMPSGSIDMDEDVDEGYGGSKLKQMLIDEGFMDIPSLFPPKS